MTRPPSAITFLGPVFTVAGPKTVNNPRLKMWGFLVLNGVSTTLPLQYNSEEEAYGARRQLLLNPSTYSIDSQKAFKGVQQALQQAYEQGQNSSPEDDPETTSDVS